MASWIWDNSTPTVLTADLASSWLLARVDGPPGARKQISIQGVVRSALDGSAAAPGHAFANDATAGLYRLSTGEVGIAVGGVARLIVDTTGKVGIGTTSPSHALSVASGAEIGRAHV